MQVVFAPALLVLAILLRQFAGIAAMVAGHAASLGKLEAGLGPPQDEDDRPARS